MDKFFNKITIKSLNEMKEDQSSIEVSKALTGIKDLAKLCDSKSPITVISIDKKIGDFLIQGGELDYTESKTTEGELIINTGSEPCQIYVSFEHIFEDKSAFSDQTGPEGDGKSEIIVTDAHVFDSKENDYIIAVTGELSKEIETILYYLNDKTNK